jgi:hypothetical protein
MVVGEDAIVIVASDDNNDNMRAAMHSVAKSKRKRQKHQFPWEYVKDWQDGDSAKHCGKRQCMVCRNWYSGSTNASGWKAHMKSAHGITGNDIALSASSSKLIFQSTLSSKPMFSEPVLRKYENAIVDYVVEGGVTLRAAGGVHFKKFIVSLTNGYEPPSTRTILRRIAELYRILEPLLATFLCNLDVAISLTLDGWSNRNLKGFYIVTAHWVDVISLTNKNILLTILDVKCGTGVSNRVGAALFEYLKRLGRDVVTRLLNVVSDNGTDATVAVARLFQLVNTFVGYEQMRKVNHVRCADHSVQLAVLKVLTFIKEPTEQLRDALIKSAAAKSCGSNIASKPRQPGLPARSRRTRTRPRAGTRLTRCAPTLLASASFWTASWTSTRPTLATVLSLTWNGMPLTACRRSFARRARSWRASRPITSRRSTWCRCPSLYS